MKFRRLGHVYVPSGEVPWARSHASTPFASVLDDGRVRVYFTSRDGSNRSHIGVVHLVQRGNRFDPCDEPSLVLEPGSIGLFDEHGVGMGSVVVADGVEYLYYVGWSLRQSVPWQNTIGLAVRRPGERSFRKHARVPLLDRSEEDPYSMSYPWAMRSGNDWTLWYGTNLSWGSEPGDMEHVVRRAVSRDGLRWERDAEPAIDIDRPEEYAVARPSVVRRADAFEMVLSSRTRGRPDAYDLCHASSRDGRVWTRTTNGVGLGGAPAKWEVDMVCYPCAFEFDGDMYLLYCGNGFGATGFGAAVQVP